MSTISSDCWTNTSTGRYSYKAHFVSQNPGTELNGFAQLILNLQATRQLGMSELGTARRHSEDSEDSELGMPGARHW